MSTTTRVVEREARYHPNSYQFVYQALRYTQQNLKRTQSSSGGEDAHISGPELLEGIRRYSLAQFGLLARAVFARWGVRRTDDFGRIVFEMIARGEMSKTDQDQLSDFEGVYSFEEVFDRDYRIDVKKVFKN